jgi:hypothetical protein
VVGVVGGPPAAAWAAMVLAAVALFAKGLLS